SISECIVRFSTTLDSSFFIYYCADHRYLHSFPTRRSSDLIDSAKRADTGVDQILESYRKVEGRLKEVHRSFAEAEAFERWTSLRDRKSTRLNSSHGSISYAVFCLKKKRNKVKPIYTLIRCL